MYKVDEPEGELKNGVYLVEAILFRCIAVLCLNTQRWLYLYLIEKSERPSLQAQPCF